MDLLTQLGVNETLGIQLATFLVVFALIKVILFDAYFAAFIERKERTLGKTETAERFVADARVLEEKYAMRAQEANDRFREVYDKGRGEALREHDRLVTEARNKSKGVVDEAFKKIHTEMDAAKSQLNQEVKSVAQLINHKLIGKDLST